MAEHVTSKKTYSAVFGALMLLLVLTLGTGGIDLGIWSLPVAMSIAVAKALLIALFFMHLVHSSMLARLMALGALLWLAILMTLAFSDYATRSWRTDAWGTYHPAAIDRSETDVSDAP